MKKIFLQLDLYVNFQQLYNSNELYAYMFYELNVFKRAISENNEALQWMGLTLKIILEKFQAQLCLNHFFFGKKSEAQKSLMAACFMVSGEEFFLEL